MNEIRFAFAVDPPRPDHLVQPIALADGSGYNLYYRYARRGAQWWAILDFVKETMPPRTPQISSLTDADRLPMMDAHGPSAHLEADQRRKEWAAINAAHDHVD